MTPSVMISLHPLFASHNPLCIWTDAHVGRHLAINAAILSAAYEAVEGSDKAHHRVILCGI